MRVTALVLIQIGALIALGAYLLDDVDSDRIFRAITRYSTVGMAQVLGLLAVAYVLVGLRMRQLSRGQINVRGGAESFLFGTIINSLFPARLGEIARLAYLAQVYRIELVRSMPLSVIERTLDLLALITTAVAASTVGALLYEAFPYLAAATIAVGLAVAIVKLFNQRLIGWLDQSRLGAIRGYLRRMLTNFDDYLSAPSVIQATGLTLVIWLIYLAATALFITRVADLNLDSSAVLVAFALSSLGLAIPIAPAGMGTYHAGLILGLTAFGTAKEDAVAAALVLHFLKIIGPISMGPYLMFRFGIPMARAFSIKKNNLFRHDLAQQIGQQAKTENQKRQQ